MMDESFDEKIGTRFAVNVSDMTKWHDEPMHPVNLLLVCVLQRNGALVDAEPGRIDGMGTLVDPLTPKARWEAIYELIRDGMGRRKGIDKNELRIYKYVGKGEYPPNIARASGTVYAGKWERI